MEEKSAATMLSSADDESAPTNVRRSLVGSRRMLFEQQIVSTAAKDIAPPPSSSRVSRVSIRTLPLNDRAAYSSSSSSSSERDSKTPSPQPLPPQPLPSALLDDSTFAKRTSYHHAVFKSPELILPSSSSSRSKTKDEQITKVEENEVEGRFNSSASEPKDEIEERLPSSASELKNEIEERLPSVKVPVAQPADEKEERVSVPSSLKCQPEDEQEVANVSLAEDEAEQRVPPSTSCPDSVVIISQDLSSAKDNDRISSLSSSRNNRESITATGTATTTIANEDDCNNDRDEDGDSAKEEPAPAPTTPDPVHYPEELNPFADEEEATVQTKSDRRSLNPFGSDSEDEDESAAETSVTSKQEKHESTNPFGSESEDEEDQPRAPQPHKPKPNARKMENGSRAKTPVPLPRSTIRTSVVNLSPQPSPRRSVDSSPASSRKLSADSLSSRSGSSSAQSTIRKKKPAPPPPPLAAAIARNSNQQPIFASMEQRQQQGVTSPSSNDKQDADANKIVPKRATAMAGGGSPWKHKKGPAPARPTPQRRPVKEMPIGDIQTEIGDIEVREQELERQGVQLEQMIRERTQTESPESPGVEEMVLQLFELVNEKNELFRRRSELINMRKMHHLEQEHAELEYQIRCLMLKPASNKTDSDKEKEEELIKKLLDVVERRNEIIEKMEKDRQRETVEDQSVITQLDDQKLAKSPPDKKKKDEKKSKKHKKDKTRKDDALLNGDEKEKHHSPSQLIKQKFMTMTLRHSTKKLPPPRLSN